MADFDPYTQNVTFLAADGETNIHVPVKTIDVFNIEAVSISISYGAQIGASLVMLLVVLITTQRTKFRRPSIILHILGLVVCIIRMALLCAFFPSPFNEFYNFYSGDYSNVPRTDYNVSVAGNTSSLVLVIIIEGALINQAWTMVRLWPDVAKYTLTSASFVITLITIGFRTAFTVIQSEAVFSLVPALSLRWLAKWTFITNAISICWFCALFNAKLLFHLVAHRGVLPSYRSLTPMEVLVMTNGVLMIIPVIFTALEFRHYANFEAASLALTSVVIMLPLGTLAAQRMSKSAGLVYATRSSHYNDGIMIADRADSAQPLKPTPSLTVSSHNTGPIPQASVYSRCEAIPSGNSRQDPVDLELGQIDGFTMGVGHVRVDRDFEQREERL